MEGILNEKRALYYLISVLSITVVVFIRSGVTLHQQVGREGGRERLID